MLVLPIALEKNEVRRMPWVSFALIGLCFLVHIAISTAEGSADRAASERVDRGIRYATGRMKSMRAGEMGFTTTEVGDLVVEGATS